MLEICEVTFHEHYLHGREIEALLTAEALQLARRYNLQRLLIQARKDGFLPAAER